ncbi:uncharacterized protein [Littorina saxatilis]|uniref:uncharacterized protein n=1 Tax=Littorina saxatilis TaxID=31220 RepID=UPI0038B61419
MVPAQNCRVEARSGSWTFDGSCNITKTFSSSNNYECRVFRGTTQSSQPTSVKSASYTPRPHSNASYRTGSCFFSSDFTSLLSGITSRQDFYFRIDVYPGPTRLVKGPVTLQRPVSPTIRCPDIVAENTTLTCTCSTTNLGQPAGRLAWSRVTGGTIIEGEYDVTTLTLPSQTLTRHDQGVNKFHCDVKWAAGSYTAVYTGNIGFPPSETVLKLNSASPNQTVTISENSDLSFTCTATDGNPNPTLTLVKAKSTVATGSSPLIHSLGKAQCRHSGNYTCTAKNGYGDSLKSSTRLYVNCLPRTLMKIPALNFNDKKDERTFTVTAYPAPTLNLSYLGKSESTKGSPTELPDSIQMNGSCKAIGGMIHQSTCTITVYNVTSDEAAGDYQVTLTNRQGNTNATFEIKYKAPVSPSQESELGNAAVIGGVIGAVVVAGIIAFVVVIVLKRRKDIEGTDPSLPYDSLQMSDVGLRSVYSSIEQTLSLSMHDPTYQNTVQ